ncbi:hypothetical protein ACHAXA_001793 [Cyclostephanos tholiformis]|uniref:VTT domain-containing protein n=1 Tax=Cyclostephanos tholiformis TaxID=382380 RepID=A0ABD3SE43_9STRA
MRACRGTSPDHIRLICRVVIIIIMIVTITFTCLDLLILHKYLYVWLDNILAWLLFNPVSGGLVFIGVFLLGSLCFFPVALLSLGAGYVYENIYGLGLGIFYAFLVCYVGCLLGAAVCFARSRFLMRRLIERFSIKYPIVRAVDRAFETNGFRIFLLLRLSPALPFNALNYIGGIMAIRFRQYWWSTCVGIAPSTLWTVIVGALFGTMAAHGVDGNKAIDSTAKAVVLGLGILFGVLGFMGTAIYARRELTKIIMDEQNERAIEERADAELAQNFMSGECEAITEEDGDSSSFEDLENPHPGNTSDDISQPNSQSNSPTKIYGKIYRRPWTPDAVASELPILPKVLNQYLLPKRDHVDVESNEPISSGSQAISKKERSASMPGERCPDDFSSVLDDSGSRSSSAYVSSRRHTVVNLSPENIRIGRVKTSRSPVPRSRLFQLDDGSFHGLANIDESNVYSGYKISTNSDSSEILNPAFIEIEEGTRRRCHTDPTNIASAPFSTAKKDQRPSESLSHYPRHKSILPKKGGLRTRHPIDRLGALQCTQQQSMHPNDSPAKLQELINSKIHNPPARSTSMIFSQREEQPVDVRRRSSSSSSLSPSMNHLELNRNTRDGPEREDQSSHCRRRSNSLPLTNYCDGEPSREWFWIWA